MWGAERYASQSEILSYIRHVAERFDLRRHIRFNTRVTGASFEAASAEAPSHWTVTTDDGQTHKAGFCDMAAMKEATAGNLARFDDVESLLDDLHEDD